MNVEQQVAAALRSTAHGGAEQAEEGRLTYALGWVVANAIVGSRYLDSAIDALPVEHPKRGWDRFLLTRRVSCQWHADEPADAFGLIMLDGDDPPRLTQPNGTTRLALGRLLRTEPRTAIEHLLALFPPIGLSVSDHAGCPHTLAPNYPQLYATVTDLIVSHPTITAAREIFVDDAQIDGSYHPLYVHTARRTAQPVHDWFELQTPDYLAYCDLQGDRAIYLTERGWWSTVAKPLSAERPEMMGQRILAWLRIKGVPDPAVD